jgi:hypothetical protein
MVRGQVMVNGSIKSYEYLEYPKWVNGQLINEPPPILIKPPEPPKKNGNGNTSQKVNK